MPDEAPYRNFNFVVEIDEIAAAAFSEVVLPEASVEVVEYREGGDKVSSARKLPGRVRYGNVVLRRGVADDLELYEWWRAVADGRLERRAVRIVLLDAERAPVRSWNVARAWPARYATSALAATGNEIVIETLELANEGVEVEATR